MNAIRTMFPNINPSGTIEDVETFTHPNTNMTPEQNQDDATNTASS